MVSPATDAQQSPEGEQTPDAQQDRPESERPRDRRRAINLSLLVATLLGVGAWYGADAYFSQAAKQRTADCWAAFDRCLLGASLEPGELPSERLGRIESLTNGKPAANGSAWPGRCLRHAQALDRALSSHSMQARLGSVPSASSIIEQFDDREQRDQKLDALWNMLTNADIPLAQVGITVAAAPEAPTPPKPPKARLTYSELGSIAWADRLSDVLADTDIVSGRVLRLLFPQREPLLCRLTDGRAKSRWANIDCRKPALSIPGDAQLWRFARAEPEATDLFYALTATGKDGFYDAISGHRIWNPRSPFAQASVGKNGTITVLDARHRKRTKKGAKDRSRSADDWQPGPIAYYRLVRLRLGQAPSTHRLDLAATARPLLLWRTLIWSKPDEQGDELYGQPILIADKAVGSVQRVGTVPSGSQHVADCATDGLRAVLLANNTEPPVYTVLFGKKGGFPSPVRVGAIAGRLSFNCHGNHASLTRLDQPLGVSRWMCGTDGCEPASSRPLSLPRSETAPLAVGSLGEQVIVVWVDNASRLWMRQGRIGALHHTESVLLFEAEPSHSSSSESAAIIHSLRLITSDSVAALLIRDDAGRVSALRIDANSKVSPLRPSRL